MSIPFFDNIAAGFDTPALSFHAFAADHIVQALAPLAGKKVLDIGTGTGHVALAAAQAVKPDGRVHAVDNSPRMLDQCFAKLQHLGVPNVDLHEMDAMQLNFRQGYFDVAVCAFALPYMPDAATALQLWKECLRPDGKLILAVLGASSWQPMLTQFYNLLQNHGVDAQTPERLAQARLSDMQLMERLLLEAGFARYQIHTRQLGYHLKQAQDWLEVLLHSHHYQALTKLSDTAQADLLAEHLRQVTALMTDKGLYLNVETHFVAAYK